MDGWVWVYAHEDVSKWPELDPQEFHRRVMGQCGQSNNYLLSLAVSFGTVLEGQSLSCSILPAPPPQPSLSPTSFSVGVEGYFPIL